MNEEENLAKEICNEIDEDYKINIKVALTLVYGIDEQISDICATKIVEKINYEKNRKRKNNQLYPLWNIRKTRFLLWEMENLVG